jgi:hypothetical protein
MIKQAAERLGSRLKLEEGFTMIVAMGVMLVVSLLCAAAFLAVQGDAQQVGHDLRGKQAYAAAQAGVQAYLYQLNENALVGWWEQCSNDAQPATTVPGSTTGVTYAWAPVATCSDSDPVGSLIDTAGNLRMEFTGAAGTGASAVKRTIVASFTTNTPLSYLWYTVHETLDPAADSDCAGLPFYYNMTNAQKTQTPYTNCQLNWQSGDKVNGPLYTQDQLLIGKDQSPSFENVTSDAPSTSASAVCVNNDCEDAKISGTMRTVAGGGDAVPFPTDNSSLLSDAQQHGLVFTGTVNVILNGTNPATTTVINCPTTSSSSCTSHTEDLTKMQLIYASNGSGCNTTYNPQVVKYALASVGGYSNIAYGPCGDIYVRGTYATSLTLASANDIVIMPTSTSSDGIFNTTDPTGTVAPTKTATLGLVANEYVRVYHPATFSTTNGTTSCSRNASNPNVTIDAAILTLQHSFFVDNYTCGSSNQGQLTVHGAIAQEYRGAVGQVGYGYLKNYNWDSRLATLLPPYMFDLQSTQWTAVRETLCSPQAGTCTSSS